MNHDLKSVSENFRQIVSGKRKSDLRLNDRNFVIGDTVTYREFSAKHGRYTNADSITVKISDIVPGDGIIVSKQFVILSIEPLTPK
jgi:hypothetical protein